MDRDDVIWLVAATALSAALLAGLVAWQAETRERAARTVPVPVVVYDRPAETEG